MYFNTKKKKTKKKHHYKCELCFDDLADTQQFYNTRHSQEYTFVKLKRSQRENERLLCWQEGLVHFNYLCSTWLLNMSLIFDCFQIKLHQQPRLLLYSATCPSFELLLDSFWKVRVSTRFVLRYFFFPLLFKPITSSAIQCSEPFLCSVSSKAIGASIQFVLPSNLIAICSISLLPILIKILKTSV